MKQPNKERFRRFSTGAVRSTDADAERYDLISPIGLRRLARVYAQGATKYGPRNWEKGMPVDVVLNHGLRHLNRYQAGDRTEDHLGKIAWAMFALMHYEETR
jgi:hypothetical protein